MSDPYPKIQTLWLRDPATKHKTLLENEWARPEFDFLHTCEWFMEEKVDGTNVRVMYEPPPGDGLPPTIRFGGRTDNAQMPTRLLDVLAEMFPAGKMREQFGGADACLYGEGYGAKIQKGGGDYIPDNCSFILFDVQVGKWWLTREQVTQVAESLGIERVPLIGSYVGLDTAIHLARVGFPSQLRDTPPEGLILRPVVDLWNRKGERVIGKIKLKDFPR